MPTSSPRRSRPALRTVVNEAAVRILSSDQFDTVWKDANRRAHAQLVKALTGTGTGPDRERQGRARPVGDRRHASRLELDERGITIFDKIPANKALVQFERHRRAAVGQGPQRDQAAEHSSAGRSRFSASPASAAGSRCRRTGGARSIRWGIGVAVAVALVGAGVAIGRSFYLDAVTSPQLPRDTAAAVFDTLVRFLRYGVRLIIAIGLVVAFAAWVTGPDAGGDRTFARPPSASSAAPARPRASTA